MRLNTATVALLVLCVLCVVKYSECYRILAIVPTPSYSHQIPYRRLWIELSKRGHEVTLVTANPIKYYESPNFKQIDVTKSYDLLDTMNFVEYKFNGVSWFQFCEDRLWDASYDFTKHVFNSTEMQQLYAPTSNATFDVMLVEFLYMPALYGLSHRFNAPMIGLSSLGFLAFNEFNLGGFVLPSHDYTWEMEAHTGPNVSFWRRLRNFVTVWRALYILHHHYVPQHQKLAEKYLGPVPPLLDIMKNVSLIFIDQADVLTAARPKLANMITFSSFHIKESSDPLPKDLQKFLDEAKDGFIYFSLGSNARSIDLPLNVRNVFLETFAKIPYRVVWKFEGDLPEKSANVYASSWLPQQKILAHPNIKIFMYQGGLQSSEEAVHFAVPVIGMPVLADQDYQVGRMVALGIGKQIDILTITKEELESSIREIISDKKYKERMLHVRKLFQDTPYDVVENLVWWTEYVVRSNGAPHLRSNLAHQPWYQRYDIDIIMFLTIVSFLVISNVLNLFAKCTVLICKRFHTPTRQKQKIS